MLRAIRKLSTYSKLYFEGDPQTIVHFKLYFEGDPQNTILANVYFEGDPQNIVHLKPSFHSKKHYINVVNSVLNTEQIERVF